MIKFKIAKSDDPFGTGSVVMTVVDPRVYISRMRYLLKRLGPLSLDCLECLLHPRRSLEYVLFILKQREHLFPSPTLFHRHEWVYTNKICDMGAVRSCKICCGVEGDKPDFDKFVSDQSPRSVVGAPWEEVYGYLGPIRKH